MLPACVATGKLAFLWSSLHGYSVAIYKRNTWTRQQQRAHYSCAERPSLADCTTTWQGVVGLQASFTCSLQVSTVYTAYIAPTHISDDIVIIRVSHWSSFWRGDHSQGSRNSNSAWRSRFRYLQTPVHGFGTINIYRFICAVTDWIGLTLIHDSRASHVQAWRLETGYMRIK